MESLMAIESLLLHGIDWQSVPYKVDQRDLIKGAGTLMKAYVKQWTFLDWHDEFDELEKKCRRTIKKYNRTSA